MMHNSPAYLRKKIFLHMFNVCYISPFGHMEYPGLNCHKYYLDEPLLSVIVLSTRIVYGKSSSGGKIGSSALSASIPCPISLLLGAPIRPTSPTHDGGNEYCSMSTELDNNAEYSPSKNKIQEARTGNAQLVHISYGTSKHKAFRKNFTKTELR
jgi:hypothetical protein